MSEAAQWSVRAALGSGRQFLRVALRDPESLPERITLFATSRGAGEARAWAQAARERPGFDPRRDSARLRGQSAAVARIDGAIAGTPFFVALVPGYLAYLQQEARMTSRIAALYGHDPGDIGTAAAMLALRGVHPTPEIALARLREVRDAEPPPKPAERRPLRSWFRSVYLVLVFGGFIGAPRHEAEEGGPQHSRLRTLAALLIGGAIWVGTWVFPLTFMVVMAWGCESHTRQLGRRAQAFYDGDAPSAAAAIAAAERTRDSGHGLRAVLRTAALFASIAIPIGFVAYADSVKQATGVNWVGALGALVAVSIVIAVGVAASRR